MESLHKGESDPRSSPSKYLQDEIKLLFETYIISLSPPPLFHSLSPPFFPPELVGSVQLSNSPGEDQPSSRGRQTSTQVLINAKGRGEEGVSWEKAEAIKRVAKRENTGGWNR